MKSLALVIAAALVSTSASAVTINGLYNSGVNSGGANWGAGGGATTGHGADPHWTLVGGTAYNGGTNNQFPIPPWISETTSYRWLNSTPSADADTGTATYVYRLTFDLTGFNPATASFAGQFAIDNFGTIALNGVTIGSSGGFSSFSNFSANSGFLAGINTIEVAASNSGGPGGALIEFTASDVTAAGAVPEPAQWALMLGGFGLAGAAMRRRRARVRVTYA